MFQPFRFLHASDLNLHQPCQSTASSPDTQSNYLLAPLAAAEAVFETARLERVDFVVLSGNVLQPTMAGAREFSFLVRQFKQLAEAEIPVYWAGGPQDSHNQWPDHWQWPDNVHYFSHRRVEEVSHFRDDEPICTLIGLSCQSTPALRPADFRHSGTDCAVAVAHGESEPESFVQPGITYWALGGRSERSTVLKSDNHAHYAGTHQARCAAEVGPRGCTLVHVSSPTQVRTQFIATDRIRWVEESLALGQATMVDDITLLMLDRLQRYQAESASRMTHVRWQLSSTLIDTSEKRAAIERSCGENWRESFPKIESTFAWDTEDEIAGDWYDEESILGDFLRSIQSYSKQQTRERLPIEEMLTESQRLGGLGDALRIDSNHEQRELLRQCAQLGSSLLRGKQS